MPSTSFSNTAGDGKVIADGFTAASPSSSSINNLTVTGTFSAGQTTETVTTVAAAGATQGTATAIAAAAVLVNVTATLSSEGVKLPTAATGKSVTLLTPTTKGVKVYGGAAAQVINAATTASTAYVMTTNQAVTFYGLSTTAWRAVPTTLNLPGAANLQSTLAVTGLITSTGGMTVSGAQKETITTVAAVGATQGAAAAIAAGAVLVNVTATLSSEGVKLPTAATGRVVTLLAPTTKGFKAYGAAAGQIINAATTATTAYAITTNQAVTFYGLSATAWRAIPTSLNVVGAANFQSTLGVTGLATFSGGSVQNGQRKVNVVTVAATGNAVGNARTVGTTSSLIRVTATASTEGVKLPTPSTGLQVQIQAPTAVGVKVYASAAGQSIGTGTTNTTAFLVTANTGTLFTAISTTKWLVSVA